MLDVMQTAALPEYWPPVRYSDHWNSSHFSEDGKAYVQAICYDRDPSLPVKYKKPTYEVVCITCNSPYAPAPDRYEEWRTGMCRQCFTKSRHRERVAARKKKQIVDGKVEEVGNEKRKR